MPPIQRSPGHQHVSPGSPWVGEVYLLQYNHGVLYMTVIKVETHCCPRSRLSPTPLDGLVPRVPGGRESHIIGAWIPAGGRGTPMPSISHFLPVLCL